MELKMCGHGYAESYARDGLEQIAHYMENKRTDIGYLIVFDSRVNNFAQGFNPVESMNGKTILTRITDVRPYVKKSDTPPMSKVWAAHHRMQPTALRALPAG